MRINTISGYISYMDILGFTSRINDPEFKEKYNKLIDIIANKFQHDPDVSIYIVSDSIVLISQKLIKIKSYTQTIYAWALRNNFWIRGAISQGDTIKTEPKELIKDNQNIIFPYLGKAYLTAYNLESKLNMAGIVIEDTVVSDNPDLPLLENEDYIKYQEYLPKEGHENKKRLLLPWANEEVHIINTMYYFKEMLRSHSGDIDKYINTFCFYIELLSIKSHENLNNFIKELLEQFTLHGCNILIPNKIVIIFIAVIDGLLKCYGSTPSKLKSYINTILSAIKKQNFLNTFIGYLREFDRKRNTDLYKETNKVLSI